jgi:hypothetical protein
MLDWLMISLDPARAHEVAEGVAWHGRLMVAAWSVAIPLGVLLARFGKIWPGQDWPRQVDSSTWWHGHLALQYCGGVLMAVGFACIVGAGRAGQFGVHGLLGYAVLAFGLLQYVAGWLRGSKGGPTEADLRGDHYDMTPRRKLFEHMHKSLGYVALALAASAMASGLQLANAPRWMALALALWWLALVAAFAMLQRRGRAVDTYQAIWGPDARHPGNSMKPIGWGVRRLG